MSAPAWHAAYASRRVLITGGLGFIGSTMARRLLDLGAQVSLLDALIPEHGGTWFNLQGIESRVEVILADARDADRMAQLVGGHEYLFNLAGQRSHLDSMREPEGDLDLNCRSALATLEACRWHNPSVRILYASTRQVYGAPEYLPVDEAHPVRPVDVNGVHKLAAEGYHRIYQQVHGLRTCVLRLTNIYGPRMRIADARQTFLGLWLRQVLEGEPLRVYGDGRQLRDLLYVDDAVEALLAAAASEPAWGQTFNVGGESRVSLAELAQLLIELAGDGRRVFVPFPQDQQAIDIGSYYTDDRKIRAALGWAPRVALRDGLSRTLHYYRDHAHHYGARPARALSGACP